MLAVVALVGAGLTAEQWTTAGSEGLALVGAGTVFGERTTQSNRPSPREDVGSTPLGSPAPGGPSGSHAFVAMRPDADAPVAYDPCRTIRYVINSAHAPPGAEAMVTESLAAVTAATGLVFEPVGATDEAPSVERDAFQPDRYGDTWAPVVIGWTTPEEEPALAGAVAGQGGSAWLQIDNVEVDGRRVSSTAAFVTGVIALDGPQIGRIANERPDGYAAARAVVMHEVGHLVGLQHVADPTQLMNPENSVGITEFQAGDLEGLRALGNGPCIPEL